MGTRTELALQLWRQSVQYKTHKYKKIIPVSQLEADVRTASSSGS